MKERITISIEKKLLKLIDNRVKAFIYASRSHGFESLIADEIRRGKESAKKK